MACGQCGYRLNEDSTYRSDYTREDLLSLGLSPALVEFVFTEPRPRPFTNWCEPRDIGWPCELPQGATAVYPLWTCNADVTALVQFGDRSQFYLLHHDDPNPVPVAETEQGLLVRLFVCLIESPRATLKELRQAAAQVGFQHLDQLRDWHRRNGAGGDFQGKLDRLVQSVDNG